MNNISLIIYNFNKNYFSFKDNKYNILNYLFYLNYLFILNINLNKKIFIKIFNDYSQKIKDESITKVED